MMNCRFFGHPQTPKEAFKGKKSWYVQLIFVLDKNRSYLPTSKTFVCELMSNTDRLFGLFDNFSLRHLSVQ